MAVLLRLFFVILAVIKGISCHLADETESEYLPFGTFKKSDKIMKTHHSEDYQDMVQELARVNRQYRELVHGFDKRNSKSLRSGAEIDLFDDEKTPEHQYRMRSLNSELGQRRVRSQDTRRDRLLRQGERNHRAHAIESGRRRRLRPVD